MWLQALQVIPRLDKDEWGRLDLVSRWLVASRSAVLVMTFLSSIIAGILAFRAGAFDPLIWLLITLGLVLAHATNNLVNDLTDHVTGVDKDNYFRAQYGPQPLEHGLLSRNQLLGYIAVTGAVALAIGVFLVWYRGGLTLPLLLAGSALVLLYTWPLKFIGLGEPAVLAVWGPLMIGGGYYVLTGTWEWWVVWVSLPYALGPTTVIFGKHIDKLLEDRTKKIRTLPVLLGETLSRYTTILMLLAQYGLVVYLVATGTLGWVMLAVFLAAPQALAAIRRYAAPRPSECPPDWPQEVWPLYLVRMAFAHTRRFGALYVLGLLIDSILVRV